jgi:hypothetical protein
VYVTAAFHSHDGVRAESPLNHSDITDVVLVVLVVLLVLEAFDVNVVHVSLTHHRLDSSCERSD